MPGKSQNHKVFIGAILFLAIFLVTFIVRQEYLVTKGEITILETRPVDPRDLLRGEYVILAYKIQTDERMQAAVTKYGLVTGDKLYIELVEDNRGVSTVSAVRPDRPTDEASFYVEGTVENGRVTLPDLEQYFVPEGAGLPIERMRGSILVEVSVHEGEARILQLLDEKLEPLNPDEFVGEDIDNEWW